jgi:hypothetical protein
LFKVSPPDSFYDNDIESEKEFADFSGSIENGGLDKLIAPKAMFFLKNNGY